MSPSMNLYVHFEIFPYNKLLEAILKGQREWTRLKDAIVYRRVPDL